MTIEEALSNLEIAGLWPVSEAARKLWRDAMLAVLDEAEAITDYNRLFTEEGVDELYAMPNQDAYDLMRQWVEVRWPALRTRIQELGKA